MMTLELSPELEAALAEQAQKEAITPEQLAVDTLRKYFLRPPAELPPVEGETLYDFLKDYIGQVEGSGEPLSEYCGELFTDYLVEKQRRGHL